MIIIMGIIGSGKGTQGTRLAKERGLTYISTGEMLRQYATPEQHERMLAGELLGDEEIIVMVDTLLKTLADPNKVLFDGFPRSLVQATWLLEQVGQGRFKTPDVIQLNVSKEEVKRRLLLRGRGDDTPEVIEKRFSEYDTLTVPILDYFKQQQVPLYEVDAAQAPDVVYENVVQCLDSAAA